MQQNQPFPYQHAVKDQQSLPYREYFKVGVRKITERYSAAYADENISKGSIVIREGGILVSSVEDVPEDMRYAVLIDENIFLAPSHYPPKETGWYINHSCSPSLKRIGGLIYIANRDIKQNEELTVDYAPLIAGVLNWEMSCECGSENCRKKITSLDWKNKVIAQSLYSEWLPFIQRKIHELE